MLVERDGLPEVARGKKVRIRSSKGTKDTAREGRPSSSPGFLNLSTFHTSACNLILEVIPLQVCHIPFVRSNSLHLGEGFTQARIPGVGGGQGASDPGCVAGAESPAGE